MLCAGITKSQKYENIPEIGMLVVDQNGSLFWLTILWLKLANGEHRLHSRG